MSDPFLLGGGGIRTHGTRERSTVFKTAPINRSGTPPNDFSDTIYSTYPHKNFCQVDFIPFHRDFYPLSKLHALPGLVCALL